MVSSISESDFKRLQHLHFDFKSDFKDFYEYKNTITKFLDNKDLILKALFWFERCGDQTEIVSRFIHDHEMLMELERNRKPNPLIITDLQGFQLRQKLDEILKSIKNREENRDPQQEETHKLHHNCFQDGRKSGYLWCIDEIEKKLNSEQVS